MANIASWTDLSNMRNDLAGAYVLTRNLLPSDADYATVAGPNANSGAGWLPVGTSVGPFTGTLDGGGFAIVGLTIQRPSTDFIGLLGGINGAAASVSALILLSCSIAGRDYTGGLCGSAAQGTGIAGVYVSGQVNGRVRVGGLCGSSSVGITSCTFEGAVTGSSTDVGGLCGLCAATVTLCRTIANVTGYSKVGGLIGFYSGTGTVSYCRSVGVTTARTSGTTATAGGLIGTANQGATISNCYARTDVISSKRSCGGLIGSLGSADAVVDKCFSTGLVTSAALAAGGLIGFKNAAATVTNSFWDTQASGQAASDGGTGKTTSEMMTAATFTGAGWEMVLSGSYADEDWFIDAGVFYPYLSFEYILLPGQLFLKHWDGSQWVQSSDLWCYIPPWTKVGLVYIRGVDDWVEVVKALEAGGMLTVAGLAAPYTLGNSNAYNPISDPHNVGHAGGTFGGYMVLFVGQGQYGDLQYVLIPRVYDAWEQTTSWDLEEDDGPGGSYQALGAGSAKGSPLGDFGSGVSVAATGGTYTVTTSANYTPADPTSEGPMPYGAIVMARGDSLYLAIGPTVYDEGIDDQRALSDVLLDSVSQGAVASLTINNIQANHTVEAIYA